MLLTIIQQVDVNRISIAYNVNGEQKQKKKKQFKNRQLLHLIFLLIFKWNLCDTEDKHILLFVIIFIIINILIRDRISSI